MNPTILIRSVEQAFERTARGMARWDDPHPPPDRVVRDEEYSRVTDPGKWRIIGARADAWLEVLVAAGVALVDRDASLDWEVTTRTVLTRTDLVTPVVPGGLPLVIGRSRIEDVDDAGISLGVGNPAAFVHAVPDCGCDACDSGSAAVIREVDTWVSGIVHGELRHLVRPRSTITVIADAVRQASYEPELPTPAGGWRWAAAPAEADLGQVADRDPRPRRPFDVDAVLADPTGWREWSGPSWFG